MSDQASLGSKRPNRDLPHELLSTVRRTAPRGIPDFFMLGASNRSFLPVTAYSGGRAVLRLISKRAWAVFFGNRKVGLMKRQKVVCFFNHAAETGGAEFALARLVAALDREHWHPVVVFGEEGPAVDLLRRQSVETYVIPLESGLGKVRRENLGSLAWMFGGRASAAARYVLRLSRFLRERAVELVHTNSMKAHALGGLAAKMVGVPLVWHLRDSLHPSCLPPAALAVMRFLARHLPDELVTVSRSVAKDALGASQAHRAHVVYDGLSAACFPPMASSPPGVQGRKWTVGIAGRLCAWKGQHLFLEAAASLIERGMQIRFELLGGPLFGQEAYAERLKQFAVSSGLSDHIHFHGFVSDVPARIRSWDLLVHASTTPDPCPNVVLEAMAAGVPVVASNGGGVPELLDGGACGMLFPMDDSRALSRCIETALLDKGGRERFARAARERAERCFRSERVGQEVASVWAPLMSKGPYARRAWPWIENDLPAANVSKKSRSGGARAPERHPVQTLPHIV